ncbi:MAG TPA: DUF1707 domain-containing protein [Gemmatimonadaceae bacterium]|nr:DUF1707 domain-containing protein [Gemmatimonadaceae bacterium]
MADQPPIVSLSAARERTIETLSTLFANDDLSMEELDRRLEAAYRARSIEELQVLTADARGPAAAGGPAGTALANPDPPAHDRLVAIMSESTRRGLWAVPQRLDVLALMSQATIDLSRASLPGGIIDIRVKAMIANVKIILPPGIRVASRIGNVMASVSTDDELDHTAPARDAPVIRLSGWALMSEVKTVVRRREDADSG